MPFLLETNQAFLNSTATPPVCLFSGRKGALERRRLRLSPHVSIAVPAASGAYLHWRLARIRWLVPFLTAAVAAMAIYYTLPGELHGIPRELLIASVLSFGAVLSSLYVPRSRRDCVRIRAIDAEGHIQVLFPNSREHVFWEYLQAQKAFQRSVEQPQATASGANLQTNQK